MTLRVLPYGERAVLVELPDLDRVLALARALAAAPPDGVEEWVPAARTVLVRFDPARTAPDRTSTRWPTWRRWRGTPMPRPTPSGPGRWTWGSCTTAPISTTWRR